MRSEALTLAFDTSAAHCAAALLQGETVLAHRVEEMAKGQAERLMPLLEELLAEAGHNWHALAAIGVGIGPGNFTGVRISVSAARGLALSLGIPAIGVSSFEAVAEGAARPIAVMLDARRGEAYAQRFTDAGAEPPRLEPAEVFQAELAGTPILTPEQATFPLAVAIGRVAASRAETPQPKPAPLYLRGADAAPPSDPPPVLLD
ncbi:tRNA threonylcarbamoyl adenosine modification protein YeaZ [Rhodobacter sp. JA431]|uniref:tRNA (adenosine(37)-N6)-threonylcarbamoyltransferase complex dimerization subunit type 1 TsaB n=1 Tax=Rhodobacter sp. JA431 TaxID=570013 RepID=UPI000BC7885B|nr:tRNA (adenosine(37)-N6)-threonylcarbamoyltransferase complex dimerization subunit type 1 TsaB [Rhodobacter sp. JA431]SOC18662.1 tRNA threonylcarbamoyl adenosine modification protein YeaZ [Rhodobacter sp. JA431]